jgi:prepilin-type N-terminal cleavage/methylation domain-containing protein
MIRAPGFSLSELLTVLAIGAVMMAIAAPNMGDLIRAQQMKAATNDLFDAIGLTRAQAIARNVRVLIAPKDANGVDWSEGWTVFVDHDGDRRPGAGDDIIAGHGAWHCIRVFIHQPDVAVLHRLQWRRTQLQRHEQRVGAFRHAVAVSRTAGAAY